MVEERSFPFTCLSFPLGGEEEWVEGYSCQQQQQLYRPVPLRLACKVQIKPLQSPSPTLGWIFATQTTVTVDHPLSRAV